VGLNCRQRDRAEHDKPGESFQVHALVTTRRQRKLKQSAESFSSDRLLGGGEANAGGLDPGDNA
jgi:hypothetical protein